MITYGKNGKVLSMLGEKFHKLTVIGKRKINEKGRAEFECICECGTITTVQLNYLTTGQTKSCGCLQIDSQNSRKGLASKYPKEYKSWLGCRSRCNPTHKSNEDYVKKDIQVCYRWDNLTDGFSNFMKDMGERPEPKEKYSIDRKDVHGDYEPDNCKWSNNKQQAQNRTSNKNITYNGKTQCLQAWADELNIDRACIGTRLDRGWSIEEALITKSSVQHKGRNDKSRQDTGMHLEYNGENLSLRQWSEHTGIPMQTLRNRVKDGWSVVDVLRKPVQNSSIAKTITYNKNTLTTKEWSTKVNIKSTTILTRLARGYTPAQILGFERIIPKGVKTITLRDKTLTYNEWAEHIGVTVATLKNRIKKGKAPGIVVAEGLTAKGITIG